MKAEHCLYGTDHPFSYYDAATQLVEQLNRPASDRELIYHCNADWLPGLKPSGRHCLISEKGNLKTQ